MKEKIKKREKKLYPDIVFQNVRKTCRSSKKMKFEQKNLSSHMRVAIVDKCNLYQNHKENLAFTTKDSEDFKKYSKNKLSLFQKFSAMKV